MAQDGNPRRVSLVLPIILITIGALFLLHNWRPTFDLLPILATYWPLILIFIGFGKIRHKYQKSRNPKAPQGLSIETTVSTITFILFLEILLRIGSSFTHSQ